MNGQIEHRVVMLKNTESYLLYGDRERPENTTAWVKDHKFSNTVPLILDDEWLIAKINASASSANGILGYATMEKSFSPIEHRLVLLRGTSSYLMDGDRDKPKIYGDWVKSKYFGHSLPVLLTEGYIIRHMVSISTVQEEVWGYVVLERALQ